MPMNVLKKSVERNIQIYQSNSSKFYIAKFYTSEIPCQKLQFIALLLCTIQDWLAIK